MRLFVTAASAALAAATPALADTSTDVSANDIPASSSPTGGGMPMPLDRDPVTGFKASLGASEWQGRFGAPTESRIDVVFANLRYRTDALRLNISAAIVDRRAGIQ